MKQRDLEEQCKQLTPKKGVLLRDKNSMRNCPNCGFVTNKSIRFCPHCQKNDFLILLSPILHEK